MDHKLRLYHVGPIQECDLDLNDFTVLTGPQSSGKSTVAEAVYFFRTVKQDILNIIMQGGPQAVSDRNAASWRMVLTQRLKDKFLQPFGTTWVMPLDMEMEYTLSRHLTIILNNVKAICFQLFCHNSCHLFSNLHGFSGSLFRYLIEICIICLLYTSPSPRDTT